MFKRQIKVCVTICFRTGGGMALLALGCHEQKPAVLPAPPPALARVGDSTIGDTEFRQLLRERAGREPGHPAGMSEKEALLEEMIGREAVYAKARAAGWEQRADVQASIKRLVVEKFQAEELAKLPAEKAPSEAELRAYWEANPARFGQPARAHGAGIFVRISTNAAPEKRAELRLAAQALLDQARAASPAEFARLAQQRSEDQATRYRGGDLGWFTQGVRDLGSDPAVTEALFALAQPGDFAPLVLTSQGAYVLKLLEKRPAGLRPFAEVRPELEFRWQREQRERRDKEFYAAMRAGLKIEINRPMLEAVPAPVPDKETTPPALPETIAQIK